MRRNLVPKNIREKIHPNREYIWPQEPDLTHELGEVTRMSVCEVIAPTPRWGITQPCPGWRETE